MQIDIENTDELIESLKALPYMIYKATREQLPEISDETLKEAFGDRAEEFKTLYETEKYYSDSTLFWDSFSDRTKQEMIDALRKESNDEKR